MDKDKVADEPKEKGQAGQRETQSPSNNQAEKTDRSQRQAETERPIRLTELAASMIKKIMADEAIPTETKLRVKVVGGGCAGFSYELAFNEEENTQGVEFTIKGVNFTIDEMSLMYLLGTEIDYVDGLSGAGFKFENPNVKNTCGCGSSFST
jgi:iron-sulfur cluster assembly accessory protein